MKIIINTIISGSLFYLLSATQLQAQYDPNDPFNLSNPAALYLNCTRENDGSLGFRKAESPVEIAVAEGRYERDFFACINYIRGVIAATIYAGQTSFCMDGITTGDIKAAVVITLRQKYTTSDNSVPLIIEAITSNWPCS